jgi:hypothetical protein
MTGKSEVDKLRILLPHWIEHNMEHAAEYRRWAKVADEASADIHSAAEQIEVANRALKSALERLGGALEGEHIHA